MIIPRLLTLAAAISFTACTTTADRSFVLSHVPSEIESKLKEMGRTINPQATAPLYASRVIESAPYQGVKVERDVHYGPAERNLLDLFSPDQAAAQPRPVLIFVHGGAFVAGNRRSGPTSPFYDNVMLWALRNGMVGVNMTYRLSPQNPWPAGAEDIGQAVAWVRNEIATRGGDPNRVFILGHSTGAVHLATYVSHPELQKVPGSGLAGALMLSGLYQITPQLVADSPTYPGYFGTDASKYEERSSLKGLTSTHVPLWFGTAELDPPSFENQALLINDTLCKAGKCPAFHRFLGHSHMSEAYSIHTDDRSVSQSMLDFIRSVSAG